ncbi:MAG: tRNA modification GTPase, partial [Prochlorotrichaceae cyanobacterium]
RILATRDRGELLRLGLKVAIVGRPNVGKSSLLNAWSQSDRAIVTPLPGTTRDVVESQLVVQGIPIQVLDTAGIRHSEDLVEQMGIDRSRQAAAAADLILFTLDAGVGWTAEDAQIYQDLPNLGDRPLILVWNKTDLLPTPSVNRSQELPPALQEVPSIQTIAAQHQGIEALEAAIVKAAYQGQLAAANLDFAINQRQASCLTKACQALDQLEETIAENLPLDFWSIDLRDAIQSLGEVTGENLTESMLDRIFSRFCIGK